MKKQAFTAEGEGYSMKSRGNVLHVTLEGAVEPTRFAPDLTIAADQYETNWYLLIRAGNVTMGILKDKATRREVCKARDAFVEDSSVIKQDTITPKKVAVINCMHGKPRITIRLLLNCLLTGKPELKFVKNEAEALLFFAARK